jgi:hypothetical protein
MYTSPSIVFGFHGCDQTTADHVLKDGGNLNSSEKSYDWLGHGVYFWEGNADRAFEWASKNKKIKKPAVVGAIINLGNCIDLLNPKYTQQLKSAHSILEIEMTLLSKEMPKNDIKDNNGITFKRNLDCAVIMRLHEMNNQGILEDLNIPLNDKSKVKAAIQTHPGFYDSVRGMFPEGDPLYPEAGFRSHNHIQLCIINPNCILGYFSPRKTNRNFKQF